MSLNLSLTLGGESETRAALTALRQALADVDPALRQMGEVLLDSTRSRFKTSTAPDGTQWAPNSETTELRYLGAFKGSFRKRDGGLTKKGMGRLGAKRPLIGESRALSSTINYSVRSGVLEIGSPMVYAAAQQFGAKQGQFGTNRRGRPIPWGDIPARPFIGLSTADRALVLDIITRHLLGNQ
jgi:phage virion morphogenesis protein